MEYFTTWKLRLLWSLKEIFYSMQSRQIRLQSRNEILVVSSFQNLTNTESFLNALVFLQQLRFIALNFAPRKRKVQIWSNLREEQIPNSLSVKLLEWMTLSKIGTSYRTVPRVVWQIFYESFIFCDFFFFHKPLGEWNNSKIWDASKIFVNIAQAYCAIPTILVIIFWNFTIF